MPSEAYEDLGVHGPVVDEPVGLDVRCEVCKAAKGELCHNPCTGKPRRNNVSCLGRVVRTAKQEKKQ